MTHVSKDSKGYGYNYSSLADTLDTVKPLLVEFGFSLSQFEDGTDNLVTMLLHKSGQFIKGRMKLISIGMKGANEAQQKGAVLSYFRRYSIQAILGMAAEDNDAGDKKESSSLRPSQSGKAETPPPSSDAPKNVVTPGKKSFRKTTPVSEDL